MITRAVIVDAARTPIGKKDGMLKLFDADYLASVVIKKLLEKKGLDPFSIEDVILGNAAGPGGNPARNALLLAGLPEQVPGMTIDRQCGSGLEAVHIACRLIESGAGDFYIAGGTESTSRAPWKIEKPVNIGEIPTIYERARFAPEFIGDPGMGTAAENVAEAYGITREAQDAFALKSHEKAVHSQKTGRFKKEIVPVWNDRLKTWLSEDESPRKGTSKEALAALKPVFKEGGTVTAGNTCPVNDGAAAVVIMSEEKAAGINLLKEAVYFTGGSTAGVSPHFLGIGPVPAVEKLFQKNNLTAGELDLVEFNEAFASQSAASLQTLGIPENIVNIGGGAIALGHPYGASGAILVTRLFHELKKRSNGLGLAAMGIGGGMGNALLFQKKG